MAIETDAARSESRSFFDRVPPRWALLMLFCLAIVVRGRVMRSLSDSLRPDPDAYRAVAWHIYEDRTFGLWQDGVGKVVTTASRPPLYPLALSALISLYSEMDPHGFGLLHVVLGVGTVWAVWRLGRSWGLPPGGSLLAAGLVAIDPILLGQSVLVMTETLATFLAAVTLLAVTRAAGEASIRRALLAGALLGLCVLCRPTFLAWFIGVAIVFALRAGGPRRLARAGALVAAAAVVVAPWAIRNQLVIGRPVITTTHGGYTLLLANNPQFYEFLRSAPWGSVWDAEAFNRDWEVQRRSAFIPDRPIGQIDEVALDNLAYRQAWQNIRDEPLMFAYACLVRVGRLWGVLPHQTNPAESTARRGMRHAVAIGYALELPLAVVGAWFLRRKLIAGPWIWGTLLVVSFTAVHAIYWTDMRMRAPLMIVVALLAAYGGIVLATKPQGSTSLITTT